MLRDAQIIGCADMPQGAGMPLLPLCMYVCMYVCVCACVRACVRACMYVCMLSSRSLSHVCVRVRVLVLVCVVLHFNLVIYSNESNMKLYRLCMLYMCWGDV